MTDFCLKKNSVKFKSCNIFYSFFATSNKNRKRQQKKSIAISLKI